MCAYASTPKHVHLFTPLTPFAHFRQMSYKFPTSLGGTAGGAGGAVSAQARRLIRRILVREPGRRLTAAAVAKDPWVIKHASQ